MWNFRCWVKNNHDFGYAARRDMAFHIMLIEFPRMGEKLWAEHSLWAWEPLARAALAARGPEAWPERSEASAWLCPKCLNEQRGHVTHPGLILPKGPNFTCWSSPFGCPSNCFSFFGKSRILQKITNFCLSSLKLECFVLTRGKYYIKRKRSKER